MRASTDAASATDAGPAGVGVPQEIVDAFVMMRVAELVRDGLVGTAIDRALAHAGNGGSLALVERADAIRAARIGIRATWSVDERIWLAYTPPVIDAIDALLASATGFDWDAGNALKVRARHQVEPGECEQAFFVEPFIVAADAKHSQREARWYALGRTFANRYLYLVFTMRGSLIRVIGARTMNRKERRVYAQVQTRHQTDPDV